MATTGQAVLDYICFEPKALDRAILVLLLFDLNQLPVADLIDGGRNPDIVWQSEVAHTETLLQSMSVKLEG